MADSDECSAGEGRLGPCGTGYLASRHQILLLSKSHGVSISILGLRKDRRSGGHCAEKRFGRDSGGFRPGRRDGGSD